MIPGNKLSQVGLKYRWSGIEQPDPTALLDYELGGAALNDVSKGLLYQLWTFSATNKSVYVTPTEGGPIHVFDAANNIEELAGTFDQNMNTFVAFKQNTQWSYRWFNTETAAYAISDLPVGVDSCKCTLDDKRYTETSDSDILIFYTLNDNLYFRMQRDRYAIDYLLREGVGGKLIRVDMNGINRLQLKLQAPI